MSPDASWTQDRLGSALRGENPTVIRRVPSGFAVIGDTQFLPGYCVLLAEPEAEHLTDMELPARQGEHELDERHDHIRTAIGAALDDLMATR